MSDVIRLELVPTDGNQGYVIATVPVTAEYPCTARLAAGVYKQAGEQPEAHVAWLWPDTGDGPHFSVDCETIARPDAALLLEALHQRAPWWAPPENLTAGSEFPPAGIGIYWELLKDLYVKPHPLIRDIDTTGLHYGIVELLAAAKAVHHLLDLIGVPHGYGLDTRGIDDRTLIAVIAFGNLQVRLDRISGWHSRETGPAGTVGDRCTDCEQLWPCDTRRMADGTYDEEGQDGG